MFLICWTFEFALTWQLDWLEECLRRQPPQPSHWSNKRRFFSSKVSDIVSHYVTFHPHKSFYWLESRNQEINPSNIPHMGKVPLKSCQARQSVVGWSSQSFRHHLPTHLTRLKIIANMLLINNCTPTWARRGCPWWTRPSARWWRGGRAARRRAAPGWSEDNKHLVSVKITNNTCGSR